MARHKTRVTEESGCAFSVGDRVVYDKDGALPGSNVLNGYTGTVVYVDGTKCGVTVQFDDPVPDAVQETRNGRLQNNCWFCTPESLCKIPPDSLRKSPPKKPRKERSDKGQPRKRENKQTDVQAGAEAKPAPACITDPAEKPVKKVYTKPVIDVIQPPMPKDEPGKKSHELPVWLL